jgi:hypothetical protein
MAAQAKGWAGGEEQRNARGKQKKEMKIKDRSSEKSKSVKNW